jgi:adenylate kinase
MNLRVIAVGIAGVGKSTVLEKVVKMLGGSTVQIFGSVMFEEAKKLKLAAHRDELRKLPVEKQRRLQKIAALKLSEREDKMMFIDTHLFIRTPEGFCPGLPFDVITTLKPTHLLLLEATSEEILSRRMNDESRYRDVVTAEELEYELELARSFIAAASLFSGAPILMVKNHNGKADEAAETIVRALKVVLNGSFNT